MKDEAAKKRYLDSVNASWAKRVQGWHEARFGMFIHWGSKLSDFNAVKCGPEKHRTGAGGVFPEGMTIA
jgi:hypothetical protein